MLGNSFVKMIGYCTHKISVTLVHICHELYWNTPLQISNNLVDTIINFICRKNDVTSKYVFTYLPGINIILRILR